MKAVEISSLILDAYNQFTRPLCKELSLNRTSFDILMFLGNNPEYDTLSDIVRYRYLKPSLVSINVDTLVQAGLLEREDDPSDRRKSVLHLTDLAIPVIEKGREVQEEFFRSLLKDIPAEDLEKMQAGWVQMAENARLIVERKK